MTIEEAIPQPVQAVSYISKDWNDNVIKHSDTKRNHSKEESL